jgi:Flp pilus assembly protein CpaB
MKASTLFVVCIALFIGLAAAAGAKYVGLFEKKATIDTTVKEEPIMILVANNDLYPGIAITAADVRVREVTAADKEKAGNFFEKNKGELLPANVAAANLRVPLRVIKADEALRRDMFQDDLAPAVSLRLSPGMSAVNVAVPKQRSAGGVIQLGEYVNVNLTSRITEGDGKQTIKTAQIARNCRVIMKRDSLWIQMKSDPDGPISFTLEANPYRAALIDFAQHKGELSLVPVYNPTAKVRDPLPNLGMERKNEGMVVFNDLSSNEYRDEDVRVNKYLRGDLQIGDEDMVRLFAIKPPPGFNGYYVRQIRGITPAGVQTIPADGRSAASSGSNGYGPVFSTVKDDTDCPGCAKNKEKDKGVNEMPLNGKK